MKIKLFKNWEYDVLGIDNYNKKVKLAYYYNFIKKNISKIEGDILEIGVYRGRSLLATALLLKKLKSNKKVYGFDSFSGFPPVLHENDEFRNFKKLLINKKISKEHYQDHVKLISYRKKINKINPTPQNISTSESFQNTSYKSLLLKAKLLGLNNIVLVKGMYSETMLESKLKKNKFMSVLLDCDIYMSYKLALPFVWKRMSKGALIYIDEYYSLKFPGARIACDEFFDGIRVKPKLISKKPDDFERWVIIK